jgi:hypothetical protein
MNKLLLLLAIIAAQTGACKAKVHRKPPEIVGESTNRQGIVTRIVRETSYTSEDVLLTPEGLRKKMKYEVKWFLEQSGKPRHELSIMRSAADSSKSERYWAVENTSLWLGIGTDPIGNRDMLYFVLFDESRIIRTRTFKVVPKSKSSESEFELQRGNRQIVIRSQEGPQQYDVLADTIVKMPK